MQDSKAIPDEWAYDCPACGETFHTIHVLDNHECPHCFTQRGLLHALARGEVSKDDLVEDLPGGPYVIDREIERERKRQREQMVDPAEIDRVPTTYINS